MTVTAGFAASYACLCAAQAATVAIPRQPAFLERFASLRSRWWAVIPVGSIILVIFAIRAASTVADGLTYLALVTTPVLAALALAWLRPTRRYAMVVAVAPLFALAWAARDSLAGEAAAVILTALACATLGVLLTAVTPLRWLKVGVVLMAIGDTILVIVQLLQAPDTRLNAAAPALGLPQFQRALFGDAVMGYGDLFIAAVLGAILAAEHRRQGPAAILTAVLGIAFGLLFFAVNVLPATVPVAVALIVGELQRRSGSPSRRRLRSVGGELPGTP